MASLNSDAVVSFIASQAGISDAKAQAVFAYYRKHKVIKHNAHDGYSVTHGAFYDREVILEALAKASAQ